jgi:hypothetical protein
MRNVQGELALLITHHSSLITHHSSLITRHSSLNLRYVFIKIRDSRLRRGQGMLRPPAPPAPAFHPTAVPKPFTMSKRQKVKKALRRRQGEQTGETKPVAAEAEVRVEVAAAGATGEVANAAPRAAAQHVCAISTFVSCVKTFCAYLAFERIVQLRCAAPLPDIPRQFLCPAGCRAVGEDAHHRGSADLALVDVSLNAGNHTPAGRGCQLRAPGYSRRPVRGSLPGRVGG